MVRILAKLLIIFILVYSGVSIWYGRIEETLQQGSAARVPAAAPPPENKTEIVRQPDDYTIIVRRNIFQAVVEKTEQDIVKKVEPEILEPTKLKLSLMGTIFGTEGDSRAIISDDAKRVQDIYQVGDSVQGAMIKTIERGKIVLTVNGKDEILNLKDPEGGGATYQPSPSDFYQEPPEPQEQMEPQEQLEPQDQLDQFEPPEQMEQPDQLEPQVQEMPGSQVGRQPVVRPRPVRRPPTPRSSPYGIDQPGMQ